MEDTTMHVNGQESDDLGLAELKRRFPWIGEKEDEELDRAIDEMVTIIYATRARELPRPLPQSFWEWIGEEANPSS